MVSDQHNIALEMTQVPLTDMPRMGYLVQHHCRSSKFLDFCLIGLRMEGTTN